MKTMIVAMLERLQRPVAGRSTPEGHSGIPQPLDSHYAFDTS